jgi:hypothetical protein
MIKPSTAWMILEPGDEGNHSGGYLVVERIDYVKYLTGQIGELPHRRFILRPEAETHCVYRNRSPYG